MQPRSPSTLLIFEVLFDLLTLDFLDPGFHCILNDMDYKGDSIEVFNDIKSAELCQQECQKEARCKMFVWVSEAFKDAAYKLKCYLKNVDMNMSKLEKEIGVVSGPRHCGR